MAIVQRTYNFNGALDAALSAAVHPTAEFVSLNGRRLTLQIDDAAGLPETMDQYMAEIGWIQDSGGPPSRALVTRVVTTNDNPTASDEAIAIGSLGGPIALNLPAISTLGDGKRYYIADRAGTVSVVNTVTITPNAADKIRGNATFVMNVAFSGVHLVSSGTDWLITASTLI